MPAAAPPAGFIPFGSLGRASGLRGALRLFPLGVAEEAVVETLDEVFVEGHGATTVQEARRQGRHWIVVLSGVRRREQAEELVNARLFVPASALPADAARPSPGAPLQLAGDTIGSVVEVRRGPLELALVRIGDSEVLLPLNAPYVRWDGRALVLDDPPEGLLP